jgi:DNA-binding transcriptional regulator YhcF (GntR family)
MIDADERVRTEEAFSGNHLLSTFAPEARALIESHGQMVELQTGTTVLDQGHQVLVTLFPVGPTMISMAVELAGGRSVEVALIGRRGAVGGIVSCGKAPAFTKAVVLVGGPAFRLPMAALEDAKTRSPFVGNLFCRFSDYLLSQVMQSVACNVFHSIPQRAARWLLHAQDRTGDRIDLTQQALAGLLGVQRTTVNAVIQSLEQDGVIASGRGVIRVLDRGGLMERSCECYQKLEDHFAAVIGATGRGS